MSKSKWKLSRTSRVFRLNQLTAQANAGRVGCVGTNAAQSAVGGVGGTEIVLHSLNAVFGANKYVTILHNVVILVGDGTSLSEPLVTGTRDSTGIIKTRGRLQKAWRP